MNQKVPTEDEVGGWEWIERGVENQKLTTPAGVALPIGGHDLLDDVGASIRGPQRHLLQPMEVAARKVEDGGDVPQGNQTWEGGSQSRCLAQR